jgi:hypothetical protein
MCIVGAMIAGYFPMDFALAPPQDEAVDLITDAA